MTHLESLCLQMDLRPVWSLNLLQIEANLDLNVLGQDLMLVALRMAHNWIPVERVLWVERQLWISAAGTPALAFWCGALLTWH